MGWTGVLSEEEFKKLHELAERDAPPLHGEMVELDGSRAYLSLPKEGKPPFPAVLVIHEWWGLNDHIKHWADRLAADGYAALAVDLYGGEVAKDADQATALMRAVDQDAALATLRQGHRFLAADPRVQAKVRAAVGWCFGGGQALRLAMAAADLDAAVIYYGRLVTDPEQLSAIRARVLGIFGNQDTALRREPRVREPVGRALRRQGRGRRLEGSAAIPRRRARGEGERAVGRQGRCEGREGQGAPVIDRAGLEPGDRRGVPLRQHGARRGWAAQRRRRRRDPRRGPAALGRGVSVRHRP
jgi:carboxymethylenebutenolidase